MPRDLTKVKKLPKKEGATKKIIFLSEEELQQFSDFLRSPFHNKNKNVIQLFEIIKKHYPFFKSDKIVKEKIFKKLFPGRKYNDVVMRILISDLIKLSEEYLSCLSFFKKTLEEKKHLLYELRERKLDTLYNKNFRLAESILENKIVE